MDIESDWLGKHYYSLNAYFRKVYGEKIYKIAVDAGLTCPNRDGSLDNRGCIFCSAGGSGDFAVDMCEQGHLSVAEQIRKGLSRFNKSVGTRFVIYFQAYTNTYGKIDYLKNIWSEALSRSEVVGISIATRPDCLGDEVLLLLKELKEKYCRPEPYEDNGDEYDRRGTCGGKFIWVELGLQTMHEKTADYIRRHYSLKVYEKAVVDLSNLNIPYITHIILGLPGETKEEMLDTVAYVSAGVKSGVDSACDGAKIIKPFGIKLQLLHVLEETDLAEEYKNGVFDTLELNEYIDIVVASLRRIDKSIVIHRVTGDGPKSILVSPKWSGNKKLVLNTLHKKMAELGAFQGDHV